MMITTITTTMINTGTGAHGHDDDHDDGRLRIDPAVMREFGIELAQAQPGVINQAQQLPGEVVHNADRIAHVTPAVAGIARQVNVSVGDRVAAGDVLAVLGSRELASARSQYLSAQARLELAQEGLAARRDLYESRIHLAEATLARDERLLEENVGTQRQVLESRQAVDEARVSWQIDTLEVDQAIREARIALNEVENTLHALGYSHDQIDSLTSIHDTQFNAYELIAPLSGVVTQRHVTIGEVIKPEADEAPIVVADLSSVWVNLTVYQRDLATVKPGQPVRIEFGHGIPPADGVITFVSPALDETTRTATARVVLDNPNGHWRPGLFVTAYIKTGQETAAVVVPRGAVTEIEGQPVVFVQTDGGFEPRVVRLGRMNAIQVEVVEGLQRGQSYIARNVLALKAELNRAALEHAGHAH